MDKKTKSKKPAIFGILAGLSLLALYFGLMIWLNSWQMALVQFLDLWPWMALLVTGFGFQIYLFFYMREQKKISAMENTNVAASGTVSGVSMVACCMHHLTDVAPLLGISALTLFLGKYQTSFLILGIFSNIFGTALMAKRMKECRINPRNRVLGKMLSINHGFWMKVIALVGIIAVLLSFALNFGGI